MQLTVSKTVGFCVGRLARGGKRTSTSAVDAVLCILVEVGVVTEAKSVVGDIMVRRGAWGTTSHRPDCQGTRLAKPSARVKKLSMYMYAQ